MFLKTKKNKISSIKSTSEKNFLVKDIIDDQKLWENLWEQSEDLSNELYSLWNDDEHDEQVTVGDTSDMDSLEWMWDEGLSGLVPVLIPRKLS